MNKLRLIHIAITYRCNKDCNYCFAEPLKSGFEDMTIEDYMKVLDWFKKNKIKKFNITGGECTIHPKFEEFVSIAKKQGFKVSIFTNALFPPKLMSKIPDNFSFLINYNPKEHYTEDEYKRLHQNLKQIHKRKMDFNLMFNITDRIKTAEHIIRAAKKYKPNTVLMDFIMPNALKSNVYLDTEKYEGKKDMVKRFDQALKAQNIPVRVSRPFPYCLFKDTNIDFKPSCGVGKSMAHINPDLTIFPCSSLFFKGPKIINLKNQNQVSEFYRQTIFNYKWKKYLYPKCRDCVYLLRKKCQGTCLCHKCLPFEVIDEDSVLVYSQFPKQEIIDLTGALKQAIQQLSKSFGSLGSKPTIFIFKDKDELGNYANLHHYPQWVNGTVIGNTYYHYGRGFSYPSIVHALCHIFFHDKTRNILPNWFNEGVCEFLAYGEDVADKLARLMKKKELIPFSEMSGTYPMGLLAFDRNSLTHNIAYQQSASMVGYIIQHHGFDAVQELVVSDDFYRTFRSLMGIGLSEMEQQWLGTLPEQKSQNLYSNQC